MKHKIPGLTGSTTVFVAALVCSVSSFAVAPASFAQDVPYTFLVPVELVNLHPDLTQFQAQCRISRGRLDDVPASGVNQLEGGFSDFIGTVLAGDGRHFSGNVRVDLLLSPRDASLAQTYLCDLILQGGSGPEAGRISVTESFISGDNDVFFNETYAADRTEPFVMSTGWQILP